MSSTHRDQVMEPSGTAAKVTYEHQRWEYRVVATALVDEEDMNALGFEGWEMVGAVEDDIWLKRPALTHIPKWHRFENLIDSEGNE